MKDKPFFAIIYMFVVTAFFSSIVIGFARLTEDRVRANRQLAFERAVLEVFSLAEGKTAPQLHAAYLESIQPPTGTQPFCILKGVDDKVEGYAVNIAGKGFWAPIKGIMGFKPDKQTITGIAFYEQNETPGLGAEITSSAFRDQFKNKKIAVSGDPLGIEPLGTELSENQVHAITGATQTCTRLEKLINKSLSQWMEADKNLNQNE
ncbi:MAG: FMN-binding protein [Planctomycetota bacterium]|jgi:Na+-transporting NADH:ubiquinone oxidoreductase subunit C